MKAKINVTKEELENHLDDIIEQVDIGQRYEINGDDYNITITSIDDIDDFKSTYVDLSACEQILRKVNNISDDKILTMLQIEIDKMNTQSLTNQVEYIVYDGKTKLNLSCCKNTPIKVTYEIKEGTILNQTMIEYFSDMDVDIFNIKDTFFNDICYPFSKDYSDIILKDRVLYIYQNYSLCDN
jgi:tRNA/tmRNA/rRNA uracil-C5-methylase (TrmA/RlmC/RlmD family)